MVMPSHSSSSLKSGRGGSETVVSSTSGSRSNNPLDLDIEASNASSSSQMTPPQAMQLASLLRIKKVTDTKVHYASASSHPLLMVAA